MLFLYDSEEPWLLKHSMLLFTYYSTLLFFLTSVAAPTRTTWPVDIDLEPILTLSCSIYCANRFVCLSVSLCLSTSIGLLCLSIRLRMSLYFSQSACVSPSLSICLFLYISLSVSLFLSISLGLPMSLYPSPYVCVCVSLSVSFCLSISLRLHMYLYLSWSSCVSVFVSLCLSISLSLPLPLCFALCRYVWIVESLPSSIGGWLTAVVNSWRMESSSKMICLNQSSYAESKKPKGLHVPWWVVMSGFAKMHCLSLSFGNRTWAYHGLPFWTTSLICISARE